MEEKFATLITSKAAMEPVQRTLSKPAPVAVSRHITLRDVLSPMSADEFFPIVTPLDPFS